jgi:hypothetical protein
MLPETLKESFWENKETQKQKEERFNRFITNFKSKWINFVKTGEVGGKKFETLTFMNGKHGY